VTGPPPPTLARRDGQASPPGPEPDATTKPGSARRVRTPTVLQMEGTECGAAALGSVLAHYGLRVPLEELRIACGVSRDGSKANNLVRAARGYGMIAKGYREEPAGLQTMPLPQIVFWNFNHFLVVEGFGKGKVYLNDPGSGPRTVTQEEFDQAFTGVVLVCEPGPDFAPQSTAGTSLLQALVRRLGGSSDAVAYVVVAGLVLVALGLVIPTFARVFVDNVLIGGQGWVTPLLLGMGLTAALRAAVTWLQQYYLLRLETRLAISTSSEFLRHLLRLPIEFYTQRSAGDISTRVAINDKVAHLLAGDLANAGLNLLVIGFFALLMVQYDVVLTVLAIGIAALNVAALRHVSRGRVDENQKLLMERGKLAGITLSGLQTIETIKAGGAEADLFARWAGQQAKVLNAEQRLGRSTQLLSTVPPLLLALNTAAILLVGGLRVMDGSMSIGMLVAFQSLMVSFISPVNQLVTLGSTLQEVEGDVKRLDDVLRYPGDPQAEERPSNERATSTKLAGRLEMRGVTFGYSRLEPPLVEGLDLLVKPGDRVALVGGSGSGKSTVAKLVAGLYRPWSGEILLDGAPRDSIPRRVLTSSLAMVDQDIFLFEGTVRENLSLWDSSLSRTDVVQAAKDACIHEEIAARTGGYDHLIEEAGRNFSGGQRQRLEIARALVANPTILVLDEATSALDPVTEQAIDTHLRRRGCTCLIVAHRLSTIRDCDEIVVLERGKVVQRGTHDQMIKVDGPYAALITSEEYQQDRRSSVLDRL
jgi:NHLM bacteriocin system ABC transporter peptidase/ATP-binding protein